MLEKLTAEGDDDDTGSLVALAHTTGSIRPPPASAAFVEVRRISGMAYGMHTRWSNAESDFEILLARRRSGAATGGTAI